MCRECRSPNSTLNFTPETCQVPGTEYLLPSTCTAHDTLEVERMRLDVHMYKNSDVIRTGSGHQFSFGSDFSERNCSSRASTHCAVLHCTQSVTYSDQPCSMRFLRPVCLYRANASMRSPERQFSGRSAAMAGCSQNMRFREHASHTLF